jgi:hypothetical protein
MCLGPIGWFAFIKVNDECDQSLGKQRMKAEDWAKGQSKGSATISRQLTAFPM